MGTGEESTPPKSTKSASITPEPPVNPTVSAYHDWSSTMQAFYGPGGTPPFFAPTVAPPHPYVWGGQHPLMPPYGTPVPYPALYPPGGIYAHPNISTAPNLAVHVNTEMNGKNTEGRSNASGKNHRGASGNHEPIGSKTGDGGNVVSGSGNDAGTQSTESESEGSSDARDDNNQDHSGLKKGSFDQMLAVGASSQNNGVLTTFSTSVSGNPVVSVPSTNLNIGMDLWNASSAGAMKLRQNTAGVSPTIAPSGMMNDHQWPQDEREIKRQKRKQSNRESARRSRLRKQVECEDLQRKVDTLSTENHTLRDELQRLSEECEKLVSENHSIKEELIKLCGPEIVSNLENEGSC